MIENSIFIPFTRPLLVDEFLAHLSKIRFDRKNSEIIFYQDVKDYEMEKKLWLWLHENNDFAVSTFYNSNNPDPPIVDILERRRRIVSMKKQSTELIGDSQRVFCLEDDTFAPLDAFERLSALLTPRVGVVSGVEVGRWGSPALGVWHINPLRKPKIIRTAEYQEEGVGSYDGVGWYCYITPTKLYKAANYRFEGAEVLGPDVCYSWDLRKKGYSVLVDHGVPCLHKTPKKELLPNPDIDILEFTKEEGDWVSRIK